MFKVECPGCKAPYQVDERRIPSGGLKMRCPKCGTSFKVDPPSDTRSTGPNPVLGGAFGFGSDGESAPPPALAGARPALAGARPALDARPAGATGGAAPPRPAPAVNLKGTMLGVAPAGGGMPAPAPPPRPAPAVNLKGTMLGIAPAVPPASFGNPPPMRRAPEPKQAPRVEPDPFDDPDLPATLGPTFGARATPARDFDLPAPRAPQPFADLPAVGVPGGHGFDDLPTAASPHAPAHVASDSVIDLPTPSPGGRSSVAPRSGSSLAGGLDLPAVGTRTSRGVGLPSVSSRGSSPPFGTALGLPATVKASSSSSAGLSAARFGEVELPSLQAGLPEVRAATPPRVDVALPALGARGRASSAGFELDDGLPLIGNNLPSLSAGLPSPALGAGLPMPSRAAGLPAVSSTGLPSPRTRQSDSRLPALANSAASLRPPAASEPPELLDLDPVHSLPPDFGLGASDMAATRASRPDFGELDLPLGGAPSLPPHSKLVHGLEAEEADLFGEPAATVADGAARRAPADPNVVRQAGGGVAYGEVNLGDEGEEAEVPIDAGGMPAPPSRRDEDMEFGAIPQEDQPRAEDARSTSAGQAPARGGELVPRKRRSRTKTFGALFVLLVGGAALALLPAVGPFGAYVIVDHLKAGEYARLVSSTEARARSELSSDTYPGARRALATVEAARASAKRVRELPAYAAFTAYCQELRFGPDAEVHARASVLLAELAEHPGTEYVALSRAAQAASEGQIAPAQQLLDAAPKASANEADRAVVAAEIALRAGDAKAAIAAWQSASSVEKSARSAYGLARAEYAGRDASAAARAAKAALAQNPQHVGARILLARIDSAKRTGEAEALRVLSAVSKDATLASPDEMVSAMTLIGDIHLTRSRMTQAEASYGEALKINPKAAPALNGLGEALYRAGRYSEAQARFEAATQADPDDLSAKIGVAKSKLALERVEDATISLKALYDASKAAPVAYWYGRALEASGNRPQAEATYREALKVATADPQVADLYIALALLQSQQGRSAEAQQTLATARAKLPDQSAIHEALGDVALSQGNYPDAAREFRQAVALDGEDLGAKFRLGVALRRDGKFDDASKSFDEVGAVDKDYPGLALERGLLYEASGRAEQALKEYEGALAKAPKDPDLMLRVGCGKVSAGQPKDAEDLLRKVLADRPNSAEANHCLGRALLTEGTRLAEALRLLERAVELDANRAEYQLYAGWAANESGNVPKAEHALGEALRLDQGLADAYWQRGVLRQRQGAAKDAIADLSKALELRPSRYEAHASLADAYYDLGKEPQALSEWQLAIQAQPDNATWRFRYGKLLSANHQVDAAREQLTKALDLSAKDDPAPRWAWEAHNLLAHAIGLKPEAAQHWEEFLRLGPRDSPYRPEAKSALEKLGHPWAGD